MPLSPFVLQTCSICALIGAPRSSCDAFEKLISMTIRFCSFDFTYITVPVLMLTIKNKKKKKGGLIRICLKTLKKI
tara:strand:+ start:978 stop:1205 length:228 start_codon:yes stop_codon:yes gene_type:complete